MIIHSYRFITLIALFLCGSSFASNTYFECDTTKGMIRLDEREGVLRYSLTKNNHTMFTYQSKGNDFSGFKYNHYSRFQTDYFSVAFVNAGYRYSIFTHNENRNENRGISVTHLKNEAEYVYDCNKVSIDRLSDLSTKLVCDTDSAAGCE